jgi:hypothetical protein
MANNYILKSGSVTITNPGGSVVIPPQLTTSGFTVAIVDFRASVTGQPYALMRITVTERPASTKFFQSWVKDAAKDPTDPGDPGYLSSFAKEAASKISDSGSTIIEMWVERWATDTTYQVTVTACGDSTVPPDSSSVIKTIVVTAAAAIAQPDSISVSATALDQGGVPSGVFTVGWTYAGGEPAELWGVNWERRRYTDGTYTTPWPDPLHGDWHHFGFTDVNPYTQPTAWPRADVDEFWKFRGSATTKSGIRNETAMPEATVMVPASTGIAAEQVVGEFDPESIVIPAQSVTGTFNATTINIPAQSVSGTFNAETINIPAQSVSGSFNAATINIPAQSVVGTFTAENIVVPAGSVTGSFNAASISVPAQSVSGEFNAESITVPAGSVVGTFNATDITVPAQSVSGVFNATNVSISADAVTGTFTSDKIESLEASKLIGTITSGQIESLAATKLTGQITATQIQSITADKVTGQITSDQIQSVATSKLAGQVTSGQIENLAADKLTGTITSGQIQNLSVTKLEGAIVTTQLDPSMFGDGLAIEGAVIKRNTTNTTNLLNNPDFEYTISATNSQPKDWNGGSVVESSVFAPYSGSRCATGGMWSRAIIVKAGEKYLCESWVRAAAGAIDNVSALVRVTQNGSNPHVDPPDLMQDIWSGADVNAAKAAWVKISIPVTVATNGYLWFFPIWSAPNLYYCDSASVMRVLENEHIATINADKINGVIAAANLNIQANQINGQIQATQIAGGITADKITSVSIGTVEGLASGSFRNILLNGGFEEEEVGWYKWGDSGQPWTPATSAARTGAYSMTHAPGAGSYEAFGSTRTGGQSFEDFFDLEADARYTLECWVMAPGAATNGVISAYIDCWSASGVYLGSMCNSSRAASGGDVVFVKMSASENVLTYAAKGRVTIVVSGHTAGTNWYVDDVSLVKQIRGSEVAPLAITADHIQSVNASTITGTITADKIASVNASAITGTITATQIGQVNAATITIGALQDSQIGSVNVGKLVAGSMTMATVDQVAIEIKFGASHKNQIGPFGFTMVNTAGRTAFMNCTDGAFGVTAPGSSFTLNASLGLVHATAGALAGYLLVVINGNNRKIPFYSV